MISSGAVPYLHDDPLRRAIQLVHEEEHLLLENKDAIHNAIGEGLAQLDRGEGVPGEVSRARLQEKKAVWILSTSERLKSTV